jgi:hypothetical protein
MRTDFPIAKPSFSRFDKLSANGSASGVAHGFPEHNAFALALRQAQRER